MEESNGGCSIRKKDENVKKYINDELIPQIPVFKKCTFML